MNAKNRLVVKDNSLIDASYNLSLVEHRLMLLAIVAARDIEDLTPESNIEINVKDYIDQYNVSHSTAYETIKDAADVLFNRQFSFHDRYKGHAAITKARWVNKVTYVKTSGQVVLHLSTEVINLISRLEEQFTRYMLDQVSSFKSKYSIRIYELVLKWASVGKTEKYELDDLRGKLGVEDEYKQFSDFKKRVIEAGLKEINTSSKTDITIEVEFFKTGRVVTHAQFKVTEKMIKSVVTPVMNYKMTSAQIDTFGDKLARHTPFQSHFAANAGEETPDYAERIKERLHDPFYVEQWYSYLTAVGFKAKVKKVTEKK